MNPNDNDLISRAELLRKFTLWPYITQVINEMPAVSVNNKITTEYMLDGDGKMVKIGESASVKPAGDTVQVRTVADIGELKPEEIKLSKDEWQREDDIKFLQAVQFNPGGYPKSTRRAAKIAMQSLDTSQQLTPDLEAMVDDYTHVNRHVAGTRDVANILRAIVKEIRRG